MCYLKQRQRSLCLCCWGLFLFLFLGRRGPANVCSEVRNSRDVMFCSPRRRAGSDRLLHNSKEPSMQREIKLNHAADTYRSVRGFTLCEQYIQLFSLFLSVFFAWLSLVRLLRPFIETIPTHDFTITETSKELRHNGCSYPRRRRRVLSF